MSTLTNNLHLVKPERADNLDPQIFSDNFDIIDASITELGSNHIVADGLEDGWTYRKWSNGDAECWRTYDATFNLTVSWGSLYNGACASPGNYPFPFVSQPLVFVTFIKATAGTTGYSFPIWARPSGSTTTCPSFQGIDPTRGSVTARLGIYVKGLWQ